MYSYEMADYMGGQTIRPGPSDRIRPLDAATASWTSTTDDPWTAFYGI